MSTKSEKNSIKNALKDYDSLDIKNDYMQILNNILKIKQFFIFTASFDALLQNLVHIHAIKFILFMIILFN